MQISRHSGKLTPDPDGLAIVIPTWNNLEMLQTCIRSIRQNSVRNHQIVLHVNEGEDGSLTRANQEGFDCSFSAENVGICHAMNSAAQLVTQEWIVYLNDDMYLCPGWDEAFYREIKALNRKDIYLSGTMIEPRDTGNPCVLAPHDFGTNVKDFDEQGLLNCYKSLHMADWQGASWPPSLMHMDYWNKVGGFSEEFSPGMYSDPDLALKLYKAGVRIFKGIGDCKGYHFLSKSTGRVKRNDGRKQFFEKWGLSASTWNKKYLKRGLPYQGPLPDMEIKPSLKDRVKKLIS